MKISIIIPNYNGADLLKKNLPAVYKAASYYEQKTKNSCEIIVTDDHSKDDSKVVVTSLHIPITYLEHGQNGGFSTNVNRGVEKANGEIVVLLNTDVVPNEDFLIPLVEHFTDERVFAVGCLDESIEKGKIQLRGRGVGRWERGFLLHSRGATDASTTLWASGGSSAFRLRLWKKLHGLYTIYSPFYWEDIDLSYRAQKAGYLVLFEPKSKVTHLHEEGSIKTQFTENTVLKTAYRNQFFFVWLNITDPGFVISHLAWLPIHMLTAILRGNTAMLSGFSAAILELPEVLRLRRQNRRYVALLDRTVLSQDSA